MCSLDLFLWKFYKLIQPWICLKHLSGWPLLPTFPWHVDSAGVQSLLLWCIFRRVKQKMGSFSWKNIGRYNLWATSLSHCRIFYTRPYQNHWRCQFWHQSQWIYGVVVGCRLDIDTTLVAQTTSSRSFWCREAPWLISEDVHRGSDNFNIAASRDHGKSFRDFKQLLATQSVQVPS